MSSLAATLAFRLYQHHDYELLEELPEAVVLANKDSVLVLVDQADTLADVLDSNVGRWTEKGRLVLVAPGKPPSETPNGPAGLVLIDQGRIAFAHRADSMVTVLRKVVGPGAEVSRQEFSEYVAARTREADELFARMESTIPYATYGLGLMCLLMFTWASFDGGTETAFNLYRFGAGYGPATLAGEWWRLAGAMFMHVGITHFLFNMYCLYEVGGTLERFTGTLYFAALYAFSGLCGSLASALTSDHVAAGASGALFGLFGYCVILGWRLRTAIPPAVRQHITAGAVPAVIYNLIYGFSQDGIDNAAHLGGLAAGCLFALAVRPGTLSQKPEPRLALASLALLPWLMMGPVIYQAGTLRRLDQFPQQEIRVSDGVLSLPAFFRPASGEKLPCYDALGMRVYLTVAQDLETPAWPDKEQEEILQRALSASSYQTFEAGPRHWLKALNKNDVLFGATFVADRFVLVGAHAPDPAIKEELFRLLLRVQVESNPWDGAYRLLQAGAAPRALVTAEHLSSNSEHLRQANDIKVMALLTLGRIEEARTTVDEWLALAPDDANAWLCRARLEAEAGHQAAAVKEFKKAMPGLDDWHKSLARRELGMVLYHLGRRAEARLVFRELLSQEGSTGRGMAFNTLAWMDLEDGRYAEAVEQATSSIGVVANEHNLDTRGVAYYRLGRFQQAREDFDAALRRDPDFENSLYFRGLTLLELGEGQAARADFEHYLKVAVEGRYRAEAEKQLRALGNEESSG
ncbi:MAG: rhomboid family intramembrane serine protease [Candidatus Eremiobacteraeota bacterium]|nr:rhomboid family intramembrane serine protease [Candidatus Eremiobacteraeota bacterium]